MGKINVCVWDVCSKFHQNYIIIILIHKALESNYPNYTDTHVFMITGCSDY